LGLGLGINISVSIGMSMDKNFERVEVGQRYSEAAIMNGVVYLAGQVPEDASLDIAGQTKDVLRQVDFWLEKCGSDKTRILMCQIFLKNITDIAVMNEVWDAWVAAGNAPPRATVQAALANPDWLIEIVITAAQR
jgi:enamine deaminase RidA (YjgF/YER057c/UK114 family)